MILEGENYGLKARINDLHNAGLHLLPEAGAT
jgi:hypothetical protein